MLGLHPISGAPLSALGAASNPAATVQATATLQSRAKLTFRPAQVVQARATLQANLAYRGLSGTTQATASLIGRATFKSRVTATVSARASLQSSARMRISATATVRATATLDELVRVYMKLGGRPTCRASFTGYAELYRNMSPNPTLTGDLLDPADQAKLKFYVNGSLVDLASTSYYNLADMRFNYDGKYISFSEIATPTIGSPTWRPEQAVQLDLNFGSGFVTYFKGKIRTRNHQGENNNEAISYEASGYQVLANDYTVLNTSGQPDVTFTVGSTITSGTSLSTTFTKKISEAILDLFQLSAPGLNSLGIPATIGSPGLEAFIGYLPDTVQLRNMGFFAAVQQLASYQPGVRAYFDDPTQSWVFIRLQHQPTLLSHVESMNLLNLNYQQDANERYTAVKLFADPSIDHILTHNNTLNLGASGYAGRRSVSLEKDWDTSLEATWDIYRGEGADNPEDPEQGYWWVYRRFKIPESVVTRELHTPKKIRYKVESSYLTEDGSLVTSSKWAVAQAQVNFPRRLVMCNFPLIKYGNPYIRGDAKGMANTVTLAESMRALGSEEVILTYWPLGAFKYSYVTSVHSNGTVATTASTLTNQSYMPFLRYPEVGYQGTAYDFFDIQRELLQIVAPTEVTTENAKSILETHKDVKITADLPVEGDPLESAINLQRKFRVRHGSLLTGLQSVSAHLVGFRYQFGKRGQNTLSLSTDVSGLVRI